MCAIIMYSSDLCMLVDTVCGSGIIWYQVAATVRNTVCRDQLMLLASYLHGACRHGCIHVY